MFRRCIHKFKPFCLNLRSFSTFLNVDEANLDWDYFVNPSNHAEITNNCQRRLIQVDVAALLQKLTSENNAKSFAKELVWLPNSTHPKVLQNLTEDPVILEEVGTKPAFEYQPANFDSLSKRLNMARTQFLSHICGRKAYFLKHDLATLERALVNYTVNELTKRNFALISVPDILPKSVLECCGMKTKGEHSQIFHIDNSWGKDLCLSGTAEMSLAAYCAKKCFRFEDLPLRFCAVSRCYRAEAKKSQTEKGIYRVHYFTKVEMFGVTASEGESENLMNEFVEIQKTLFSDLGLHFQVLEMPPCDLGLPAYHKIDIEAWMPGRNMYGEISSASNCTDFQSRRLHITYNEPTSGDQKYCHTVNGTACAVPRMLIALLENFQNLDETVNIPKPLQPYMRKNSIEKRTHDKMVSTKAVG